MEVFSYLSDHTRKSRTKQFLDTGRPGIVSAVNFKIIDPLKKNKFPRLRLAFLSRSIKHNSIFPLAWPL